jgi:Tfp pilus assembly protein PilV
MNSYHKKYKGFTLAEAMAAMVILFVAAAAVTLPFISSASVRQESACRTLASRLAADKIEEIVAGYDSGTYQDGYTYTESAGQVENAVGEIFADPMYQNFSRQVTCTNMTLADVDLLSATVAGDNLLWVSVKVSYNGTDVITLGTLVGPG